MKHGFAPTSTSGLTLSELPLWSQMYAARVLGYVEMEKVELEQRLYNIATQDVHNSAAIESRIQSFVLNEKRLQEGWSKNKNEHVLIGSRIARKITKDSEIATYGNIVASLSPEASGEDEWYFVHCMDDGDIEELEMYEINNGIELFFKLEEEKKMKKMDESVVRTKCFEQAAGVSDQRVSNLCVTLDRLRQMLKESTLLPTSSTAVASSSSSTSSSSSLRGGSM